MHAIAVVCVHAKNVCVCVYAFVKEKGGGGNTEGVDTCVSGSWLVNSEYFHGLRSVEGIM